MKRIIAWGLVLVWCLVIFTLSGEEKTVSRQRSQQITATIERVVEKALDIKDVSKNMNRSLEYYVRKASHVLEYFILTLLIYNAWILSGIRNNRRYIFSFMMAISYAVFDEMHQAFVPGRGPMVSDVILDGLGILLALALCHRIYISRKAYKSHKIL